MGREEGISIRGNETKWYIWLLLIIGLGGLDTMFCEGWVCCIVLNELFESEDNCKYLTWKTKYI